MRPLIRRLAAAVLLIGSTAHARGVTPYLPLHLAPAMERDVERVLMLAGQPVMTRPIAAARVLDALPTACRIDQQLCDRVRRYLDGFKQPLALTQASIEAAHSSNAPASIPNRHGLAPDSSWVASATGQWQLNDYIIASGGVIGDANRTMATDTYISMGFEYAQLDVGYRDHWWSPLTDSSMLLSTQAPTMPSITLSNYHPIGSLGISYEVFMAKMSHSDRIVYQNGFTEGNPRLAGIHLAIEPVPGWSVAGNRLMQYGGGARGGQSARNFLDALFKPHEYDNTSSTLNSDQQFGNQQAAWTSRIVFPGHVPFSVYFEYAGEDSSYSGNYRLGNAALSGGIDFPSLWHRFDLTYEVSEWQNGWYVHGVYGDGMSNHGHVLGHWFGDQRVLGDGVGGQSHMLRLGWEPKFGGVAEFRYRTLQNASYTGMNYHRAHDLTARYSYPWRGLTVGGEVNVGRDVFGTRYSRIAAFANFGGDVADGGSSQSYDDRRADDTGVDYFVDVGTSLSRVRVELADGSPKYTTSAAYAPHVGVGARREVGDRSDLGVRIEFDRILDHLLISVRALDYRYRLSRHLAWTAFAGATRYNLATPAFGYYGGMGMQWHDVLPKLDLNVDMRYGDKIARDKLLPSDPAPNPRPDLFYDLMGATLYFSYRF